MNAAQNTAPDARQIEERAAQWLVRQRDGEGWSQADAAELEAWLNQSFAHSTAFWRLEATWGRADRLDALQQRGRVRHVAQMGRRFLPMLIRCAAALAAIAVVGIPASMVWTPPDKNETYHAPVGGQQLITLRDGSTIELNTNTVVRVHETANQRKVWLDRGEAYFTVTHDATRPFVVIAANGRITDLGTKFFVRRDKARLEVALVEGSAQYDENVGRKTARSALLMPGDVVVATPNSLSVTKQKERVLTDRLGWRHGLLIFDNTPLSQVAEEFNRYNTTRLVIAPGAASAIGIGGTFPAKDVAAFTRVAQGVLGLKVRHAGNEILISQ
ncbi:MAG TPA: FecR domain-containing protein [Rhizomicrobium sp.]|nr:FecR domain-containing protein [Rhizomicrobium sp.]